MPGCRRERHELAHFCPVADEVEEDDGIGILGALEAAEFRRSTRSRSADSSGRLGQMEPAREITNASRPGAPGRGERWQFLRDVAVFQLKMLVDNARDFALIPVSLGAALVDLIFKGEREGALFYKVLHWGAQSEKIIDVYSAIESPSFAEGGSVAPEFTIDAVVARLERVVVRECEKGGTAASVKAAMDRALDQMHRETGPTREKATDLVTRAASRIKDSLKGTGDE